jgi:hypothetical protein
LLVWENRTVKLLLKKLSANFYALAGVLLIATGIAFVLPLDLSVSQRALLVAAAFIAGGLWLIQIAYIVSGSKK